MATLENGAGITGSITNSIQKAVPSQSNGQSTHVLPRHHLKHWHLWNLIQWGHGHIRANGRIEKGSLPLHGSKLGCLMGSTPYSNQLTDPVLVQPLNEQGERGIAPCASSGTNEEAPAPMQVPGLLQ